MSEDELLPCPFCGGSAHFERMGTPRQSCIVECGNCGCRHESSDEGPRSGTRWNDRAAIQWSKGRDVGRLGDMTPAGFSHLRVLFDNDNDVIVEVWDQDPRSTIGQSASVEFCNPGACGGGQSTHTRKALIALMVAIEKDNAEMPHKAWPASRDAA